MSTPTKDIQTTVDGGFARVPPGKRLIGANTF